MASSSSPCITSSEGTESTDINWEQAQQESASIFILNVLKVPTPADISMECTNNFDYSFLMYRSVPHICPPSRISPPYIFSQSSCTGIFFSRIGPPTIAILPKMIVKTPTLSSSRSPWPCKNEASVHRTAKEFAVDQKRVREWCQSATAH